jgi:hypothetical protein
VPKIIQINFPVVGLDMAPRGRKPSHPHFTHPSSATKVSIDAIDFYEDYVLEDDKVRMIELEEKVRQIRYLYDDDEVEA